jgi:hypothetical protein
MPLPKSRLPEGDQIMTKARARARAKAKAGQKAKKREVTTDHPGETVKRGQFDPGSGSIKTPGIKANTKSFSATGRGAARSR